MKEIKGDVIKINITPATGKKTGTTHPFIRFFTYKYGIKKGAGKNVYDTDARKGKNKDELAKELGKMIISKSKVLKGWFKK